jgi:uncharacterized membrane protein
VIDLGPGSAQAISPDGHYVTGYARDLDGNPRPFVWDGMVHDLGVGYGIGVAVNDAGQVAGNHSPTAPSRFSVSRGFRWQAGVTVDIPQLDNEFAPQTVTGLSASGTVVGWTRTQDVVAFAWNGSLRILGSLAGESGCGMAFGSNGGEQIAGMSCSGGASSSNFPLHAVLFHPSRFIEDMGLLPLVSFAYAYAVSDSGFVVGEGSGGHGNHGLYWSKDRLIDVGTLSGDCYECNSALVAVNFEGVAVGHDTKDCGRAILYLNGAIQDLNELADPSPWTIVSASGIGESGDIAGTGYPGTDSWNVHALLLRPH